ncbi:glycosyltransferase family 4 protein [Vagococcus fluvialis]|uniref:glycosyltransferase family 4 protein n=1 Tax=Vagococcus fluvialis TaxID=2738 RepID=UPI003B5C3B08
MKKILVATNSRGFLTNLFNYNFNNYSFIYEEKKMYETKSIKRKLLSKIIKLRLFDFLGVIQVINCLNYQGDEDIIFSFNRFTKTKKPYFIYLENPLALVHYSIGRPHTYLSKKKLRKLFSDKNLKGIICMSKACYETLGNIYDIPKELEISQVYPLIPDAKLNKVQRDYIHCLYVSSNFYLKSGREILESHKHLMNKGLKVKFTIITKIAEIKSDDLLYIKSNKNSIKLVEFNLNKSELSNIYNESDILINVSRQESFGLSILEAMKYGNVILSTDLYAQKEMVIDKFNGYRIAPKYYFFTQDNMPNPKVWNNRRNTIYSEYVDDRIIQFLFEKIMKLELDRELLAKMAFNSFEKANSYKFSSEIISKEWEHLFERIEEY